MSDSAFGLVSPHSSVTQINFIALQSEELIGIIGKLVYFDTVISGSTYRAVGTVSNITTENSLFGNAFESVVSQGLEIRNAAKDLRKTTFSIQAVFVRKGEDPTWKQSGAALPTSPSTFSRVMLLDEATLQDLTQNAELPAVGRFRGLDTYLPINTPDFGGKRGSYHSGVLGRSGSGKTAFYGFVLGTYMRHEQHAMLVIDPQGQWANENGFVFSPQRFARALGREVSVARIGEDIRIPMDTDVLSKLLDRTNAWSRFRRMGGDNKEIFSREVAERIERHRDFADARVLLEKVFNEILSSRSALSRIYADEKRREQFRADLEELCGIAFDEEGNPVAQEQDTKEEVDANWNSILKSFKPLLNLFHKENLVGGKRRPFRGKDGILEDVFKVRHEGSAPAPYVIIDMSPDVSATARAALNRDDSLSAMQNLLDDGDVKALLLQIMLREMKKASEEAFAVGGGNLNTQIIFDEAWRFAPQGRATDAVMELATQLEGFALDTRKFGIGWTYILQSPGDLKEGIWRQLSYVYAGYGLVGDDVKRLESLTDDVSQVNLYRQFISPASTGEYPFMLLGSISPIIFTTSPTFTNVFTSGDEFLDANSKWINRITTSRGLARVTAKLIDPADTIKDKPRRAPLKSEATYKVGKNYETSKPQMVVDYTAEEPPDFANEEGMVDEAPF